MTKMSGETVARDLRRREALVAKEEIKTSEIRKALYALCERFVMDNDIHCPEAIWQMDHVIGNAYEFIEEICNTIGYASIKEDGDGDED